MNELDLQDERIVFGYIKSSSNQFLGAAMTYLKTTNCKVPFNRSSSCCITFSASTKSNLHHEMKVIRDIQKVMAAMLGKIVVTYRDKSTYNVETYINQ